MSGAGAHDIGRIYSSVARYGRRAAASRRNALARVRRRAARIECAALRRGLAPRCVRPNKQAYTQRGIWPRGCYEQQVARNAT